MGLPPTARTTRPDPNKPLWGMQEELLAQLIEEVSLMVAQHQRRKPREVARPWDVADGQSLKRSDDGSVQAKGVAAVLAATQNGPSDG